MVIVNGQHLFGTDAMRHQMEMRNNTQYNMQFQELNRTQPLLYNDFKPEPFRNQTFREPLKTFDYLNKPKFPNLY